MNHLCTCAKCLAAIVEVVQGVLVEDMDLDASIEERDTESTEEYADTEEEEVSSEEDSQHSQKPSN